jgi:uncharacterized membrane protein
MIHSSMGGMHMFAALIALTTGLCVILLPKGRAAHRVLGLIYVFAMLTTCISALLLYQMTGHFGLFHVFAVLCLIYVMIGVVQPLLRRGDWMRRHLYWMGWSYLGLLAASGTEFFIHLPPLAHISGNHTFLLGGALGAVVTVIGLTMLPRWTRAAVENFPHRRA